jgi:hypothetical protein
MLQLGPIVNFISFTLDAEFEIASERKNNHDENMNRLDSLQEKIIASSKLCTVILYLLQVRPVIPSLFESFEMCFGSPDGAASWMLCCMVNSFDDSIRATGIRSLTAYIDGLLLASSRTCIIEGFQVHHHADASSAPVKASLLKSVAKIRTLGSAPEYGTRMNVPIVHKLLWHLLKCHRESLGGKTHAALINLLVVHGPTKNVECKRNTPVIKDDVLQDGYKFNSDWVEGNEKLGIDSDQRLRSTLAINTILRLLRFLQTDAIERWLFDLLTLVRISPDSMTAVLPTSEWQPCLFFLLSEIVEETSRQQLKASDKGGTESIPNNNCTAIEAQAQIIDDVGLKESNESFPDSEINNSSMQILKATRVVTRFDLCTKLFA